MSLKVLSPITIPTGSEPNTPPIGYGTLYASGSSVYFKNSSGAVRNLTMMSSSVTYFTSSGTWTKPDNISAIFVIAVGGGGGGGSGAKLASTSNRTGGNGGCGAGIVRRYFKASELTTTSYAVTVGAGGNSGSAQATDSTNGVIGSAGTATTFASSSTILVRAPGGSGGPAGAAGTIGAGAIPVISSYIPSHSVQCIIPTAGFAVTTTADSITNTGFALSTGNTGICYGGGAGAMTSTGLTRAPAGSITIREDGTSLSLVTAAGTGANGTDGTDNVITSTDLNFQTLVNPLIYGFGAAGTGGRPGDVAGTISGGNGGNGGKYGAPGGGGGPATNSGGTSVTSGAGGKGGGGLLIVIEYY